MATLVKEQTRFSHPGPAGGMFAVLKIAFFVQDLALPWGRSRSCHGENDDTFIKFSFLYNMACISGAEIAI